MAKSALTPKAQEAFKDSFLNLGDSIIEELNQKAESSFNRMKNKLNEDIKGIYRQVPVQRIQVNDGPINKVSSKINPLLPRLVVNAKNHIHTMLVGPAGCGKTTVAYQLAETLNLPFSSVCLTAGASETWLFGRQTPNGFTEGPFSKRYREGGVFLADEMDAADANLLLSINTALSHSEMLNPMNGEIIEKHKDFIFVGAANTNGKGANHMYTGRSRLDAATLDRFVLLSMTYDSKLEKELCHDTRMYDFLSQLRRQLQDQECDEFISTRAFVAAQKQLNSHVPPKEILDAMISAWSEQAKDIAHDTFEDYYNGTTPPEKTYEELFFESYDTVKEKEKKKQTATSKGESDLDFLDLDQLIEQQKKLDEKRKGKVPQWK